MTVKSYSRENVYTQKTGKLIKFLRNNQERKEKVSRLKKIESENKAYDAQSLSSHKR